MSQYQKLLLSLIFISAFITLDLIIKEYQMMKDERRTQYVNKARYERKQKESLKEKVVLSSQIKDMISKLDPKGLIEFMEGDYNKLTKREGGLDNHINTAIIRRIQRLKSDWQALHKQRFLDYLKKLGIKLQLDPKLSFKQNVRNLYDKNEYCTYERNPQGETIIGLCSIYRDKGFNTYYYLQENDERLNYKIQFSRIVKDTIYLCETFQKMVNKINRIVGIKQEYMYK